MSILNLRRRNQRQLQQWRMRAKKRGHTDRFGSGTQAWKQIDFCFETDRLQWTRFGLWIFSSLSTRIDHVKFQHQIHQHWVGSLFHRVKQQSFEKQKLLTAQNPCTCGTDPCERVRDESASNDRTSIESRQQQLA